MNRAPNLSYLAMPFESRDGTQLYRHRWAPAEPKAELVVIHGYGEHGKRYEELAGALGEYGIATTALDVRGHGKASGKRGYVKSFEDYHEDVLAGLAELESGRPRFILGHSNGGLVVLDFLLSRVSDSVDLSGVIITNPYLGNAVDVPGWKLKLSDFLLKVWPSFGVPSGLDSEGLSHDPAVAEDYDSDALVFHTATPGWFSEATAAQERVFQGHAPQLPCLFVHSDEDPVADPALNADYAKRIAESGAQVILRQGEFHEVLNETNRAELFEQIAHWISTLIRKKAGPGYSVPPNPS